MDRRTRILASIFGGVIALTVFGQFVYPRWVEPLVHLDKRLTQRRAELDKLQEEQKKIDRAREDYKTIVTRVGSFDVEGVSTDLRDRLNALIEKRGLRADSVSPSRPSKDRKTDIETMTINIKAVGTLEGVIGFLQDLSELPQFMQIGNVALYPAKSSREERGPTRMNVTVPIKLQVLPQNKIVGAINLEGAERPETLVRHSGRDYSKIWSGEPFDVYVPPVPLAVTIGPVSPVKPNQRLALQGSATGGDGQYTFQWMPSEGLKTPTSNRTDVDTATPGARTYTLNVTDGKGTTATASVGVMINEPVPAVATKPNNGPPQPPPPPPPPADPRWKERNTMQLVMMLGRTTGDGRLDELMVHSRRSKETSYYAPGQEFDGGTVVYVHQTGGLVRRKDDPRGPKGEETYWIYPIGLTLDQDLGLEAAEAFPELLRAADADKSARRAAASAAKATTMAASTETSSEPLVMRPVEVEETPFMGPQPPDSLPEVTTTEAQTVQHPEAPAPSGSAAAAPEGTRSSRRGTPTRERDNRRQRVIPPR